MVDQLAIEDSKIKDSLNRSNPNTVADLLRRIVFGDVLKGQVPQHLFNQNPDAAGGDAANLATLDVIVLPDDAKASSIVRAYARAGTLGTGEMVVAAKDATPLTTQLAVAPNGDIVFLATDAITDVDIHYLPQRGDVLESTFPVVTNVLTLPASITALGVVNLIDANAVEGTTTGRKVILAPGAGAPAAGQARLNVAKSTITFAVADAVTRATVKLSLGPVSAEQLQAALELASDIY